MMDKEITKVYSGNQVHLAENNKFILKGNAEISTTVDSITNRYKGEHENTIIWTGEENIVHVENQESFGIRTTIARSWHGVEIENTDTDVKEIKTIENRYVSKENQISILSKATDIGDLGDASKLNYEIISIPNVKVDVGDSYNLELDNPNFIKENLMINFRLNPKTKMDLYPPTPKGIDEGTSLIFDSKGSLGGSHVEIKTDPNTLEGLINKYHQYGGPIEERNEDFMRELLYQEQQSMNIETTLKGGGATKVVGGIFGKNPDKIARTMMKEKALDAGLTGNDLKNYNSLMDSFKLGQSLTLDSMSDPDNPTISIVGKESITMSKEGIQKLSGSQINYLFLYEEVKPQLQKVANSFLE